MAKDNCGRLSLALNGVQPPIALAAKIDVVD